MRTIAWFHELADESGKTQTRLQREVEFTRRGQAAVPNSKWSRYREGRHLPCGAVLEAAAPLAPRAKALFEHPMWACLDLEIDVRSCADAIASLLADRIRGAVLAYLRKGRLSSRDRARLERTPTLDGLAAHVLLARFDAAEGRPDDSRSWAMSVAKTLLVCSPRLCRLGIARPLADFIEQEIYPLVPDSLGRIYSNCGLNFIEAVAIWRSCLPALERRPPEEYSGVETPFALLSGEYGFDLVFGLLPMLIDGHINETKVVAADSEGDRWIQKLWGLYCLRNPATSPGWKSFSRDACKGEGTWAFLKTMKINDGAVWPCPLWKAI